MFGMFWVQCKDGVDLMTRMLKYSPADRITAKDALKVQLHMLRIQNYHANMATFISSASLLFRYRCHPVVALYNS